MAHRAAVVGGSGYTGAELLRLLAEHPEIEVVAATADANAGVHVGSLYPSLRPAYPDLEYATMHPGVVDGLDLAFLALPHGESQRFVPDILDRVAHIVDLGADFRLPALVYAEWYGEDHTEPALLDQFAYGIPELFRDDITSNAHVAAAGCYATAAALALAPLVEAGLIEPTGLIVDALSGVSGRGRGLSAPSLFSEADESATAYGLLDHRHTGEMEHALTQWTGQEAQVLFTPHLVPMVRGILATCHARPARAGLSTELVMAAYDAYADEPFIVVSDEPPVTKAATGSNAVHLTARYDERTDSVLAIAALDNLVKGAAGQMVQCANLLLGLPEPTGLRAIGLMP
ncbi:MAG: N-acetyl-gamma-glutamyl-phosphate reductase [Acidimicrobiia bacterium]